jgi:hypothetical protein
MNLHCECNLYSVGECNVSTYVLFIFIVQWNAMNCELLCGADFVSVMYIICYDILLRFIFIGGVKDDK